MSAQAIQQHCASKAKTPFLTTSVVVVVHFGLVGWGKVLFNRPENW
jgi:hypothetical protein